MPAMANNVIIRRLQLRAAAHWQQTIQARLERLAWPDPGPNEYLFIRHLGVRATDAELDSALQAQVMQLLAANNGASAKNPNLIRFSSYAELLAHLTEDLHLRRADTHWFWQDWQHLFALPANEAITELWIAAPRQLAEVTAQLAARSSLPPIWASLSSTQFERLGLALSHTVPFAAEALSDSPVPATSTKTCPPSETPLPDKLRRRWRSSIAALPAGHPAIRFTSALLLLEWRPDLLQSENAAGHIRSIAGQLSGLSNAVKDRPSDSPTDASRQPPPTKDIHPVRHATVNAVERRNTSAPVVQPQTGAARPLRPPIESPGDCVPHTRTDDAFTTTSGGLFYLFNFLRQTATRELVARSGGDAVLGGGWGWLYRLGEALHLTIDAPLAAFLAEQLALDKPEALADLPALPNTPAFLSLFAARYTRLQPWTPERLLCTARVVATASHVDVYFPLEQVDLDLRLAGLDIDPSWLPWLGRVVQFHYVRDPFGIGGERS